MGEAVRRYAPQAFGLQPQVTAAAPGSAITARAFTTQRLPWGVRLLFLTALEVAAAAALLLYAGSQVLPARTLSAGMASANSLAFSPDGTLLASAQSIGASHAIAFSPDGKLLAAATSVQIWRVSDSTQVRDLSYAGADHGVTPWRVADWAPVRQLRGPTAEVESVVFSPNDRLLIAGSSDSAVRVWRAADGAMLHAFATTKGGSAPPRQWP